MSEIKKQITIKEGILYPIPFKERTVIGKLRVFIFLLDGIMILASLLLWENIYANLAYYLKVAICVLTFAALLADVDKWGPSDLLISFYDDRMVLYRDYVCRGKNYYCCETDTMLYSNMCECKYRKISKKIEIYGIVSILKYEYDKNGTLKQKPCRDKTVNSMMWFYIQYTDVQEIIKEIEQHTPLHVIERES